MARAGSYIAEVEWKRMEKLYDLIQPQIDKFAEQMREEGRREILREIAAMRQPDWHDPENEPGIWTQCVFCHQTPIGRLSGPLQGHNPDCLWLRANSLTPKE